MYTYIYIQITYLCIWICTVNIIIYIYTYLYSKYNYIYIYLSIQYIILSIYIIHITHTHIYIVCIYIYSIMILNVDSLPCQVGPSCWVEGDHILSGRRLQENHGHPQRCSPKPSQNHSVLLVKIGLGRELVNPIYHHRNIPVVTKGFQSSNPSINQPMGKGNIYVPKVRGWLLGNHSKKRRGSHDQEQFLRAVVPNGVRDSSRSVGACVQITPMSLWFMVYWHGHKPTYGYKPTYN